MFELGQEVRNRDGILAAKYFEEERFLAPRFGPIDVQMQPFGFLVDGLEECHVERGGIARKVFGVSSGKGLRVGGIELQRICFVEAREQRALERVRPRSNCGCDSQFQCIDVDALVLHRQRPRDDVDSGKIGFGDLHLRFHAQGIECFAYDTLDALPYHRVVFFARHEHQARVEPSERVAAH